MEEGKQASPGYNIGGHRFAAPPLESGLYIVATPIGNLGDVTLRALATLAAADVLLCEDTRITSRLTKHYGIEKRLIPYHEHNAIRQTPKVLEALGEGKSVALASDAGTPLISDPGQRLAVAVIGAGFKVVPLPGASAVLAALAGGGLPTDGFHFAGFLPTKQTARRKRLAELAPMPATLVLFESPHRTAETIADIATEMGDERPVVIARELTKTFETFRRGTARELATALAGEEDPKGEIVILIGAAAERPPEVEDLDVELSAMLKTMSVNEAATTLAVRSGLPRRVLYQRALRLRDGHG